MAEAALKLTILVVYRLRSGNFLMERVRVYLAQMLRARVQESWRLRNIPWTSDWLDETTKVVSAVVVPTEYRLAEGYRLMMHVQTALAEVSTHSVPFQSYTVNRANEKKF